MHPWNRLDRCWSGVLLLSIFTPWVIADDLPSGRYRVRPREVIRPVAGTDDDLATDSEDSAAQRRWAELKARHAPAGSAKELPRAGKGPLAAAIPKAIVPVPQEEPGQSPAEKPSAAAADDWLNESDSPPATEQAAEELSPTPIPGILPTERFADPPAWIYGLAPKEAGVDSSTATALQDYPALAQPADSNQPEADKVGRPAESPQADSSPAPNEPPKMKPPRRPRPIQEISPKYDMSIDQDIRDFAAQQAREYNVQFPQVSFPQRNFPGMVYNWEASNFYYLPLYFEDPQLERYGHTFPCYLQPAASIARFTVQLIGMPYQMVIDPPCCPKYALGWYRPGDVAPKLCYQIPWNTKAALTEAGVITGAFFIIP